MIYLATPYTHSDPGVMEQRFREAAGCAARLMATGVQLFCPITHTHPIACAGTLPRGADYWLSYDRWFVERCSVVAVVMMDGWEQSKGIRAEVSMAKELSKPVIYLKPHEEVTGLEYLKLHNSSVAYALTPRA